MARLHQVSRASLPGDPRGVWLAARWPDPFVSAPEPSIRSARRGGRVDARTEEEGRTGLVEAPAMTAVSGMLAGLAAAQTPAPPTDVAAPEDCYERENERRGKSGRGGSAWPGPPTTAGWPRERTTRAARRPRDRLPRLGAPPPPRGRGRRGGDALAHGTPLGEACKRAAQNVGALRAGASLETLQGELAGRFADGTSLGGIRAVRFGSAPGELGNGSGE